MGESVVTVLEPGSDAEEMILFNEASSTPLGTAGGASGFFSLWRDRTSDEP